MSSSLLTWETARAAGFVAYLLVTASVAIGLVLSLRWRGGLWTRFVTTELHRFVTLLSLVFMGVHGVSVLIDPFIKFTPAEVLVPLVSHYRPVWMALGIVSGYLMVAIWLSERIQKQIGYAWWRRLHYLTFAAFVLVTIHGIATGSDTRTVWGLGVYGLSIGVVAVLLAIRLLVPGPHADMRGAWAILSMATVAAIAVFTLYGPLRPGWNAAAGGALAVGATSSPAASGAVAGLQATPRPTATPTQGTLAGTKLASIRSRFSGTFDPNSSVLSAQLGDGTAVQLQLAGTDDGFGGFSVSGGQIALSEPGASPCTGPLQVSGQALVGTCSTPDGQTMNVQVGLRGSDDGGIRGTLVASPS